MFDSWKGIPHVVRTRAALLMALFAALIATRSAYSSAVMMTDARGILDEVTAAKTEFVQARDHTKPFDDVYRSKLLIGQTHLANAYSLSLAAEWPSENADIRVKVDKNLTTCLSKIAPLLTSNVSGGTASNVLRDVVSRLKNIESLLTPIAPAAVTADPVATPTDPVATPTDPVATPSDPAPAPADATIADLVPGTGFTSATAQPAAIGTGPGSDAKALARWDVVPYQSFSGKYAVGVVAFHMSGIDRVEFSVNGGAWTAVRSMTKNPVTGVHEYNVNLDAKTLPSGQCEVRAVAYPTVGTPRVLAGPHDQRDVVLASGEHSLFLTADDAGTLRRAARYVSPTGSDATGDGSSSRPFATIRRAATDIQNADAACDGATIYLAAGDYAWPNLSSPDTYVIPTTSTRWLTLAAAPGTTTDEVRLSSWESPEINKGFNTALVHVKGLTVHDLDLISGTWSATRRLWCEGCIVESTAKTRQNWMLRPDEWRGGVYVTDSTVRNVRNASWGATLVRNLVITDIGGDGLRDPIGLVVNCKEKNVAPLDDDHCDIVQFVSPPIASKFENVIVYGLEATENCEAQALFVQQYGDSVMFENFAFVNYLTYAAWGAQWQNPGKHVLLWNVQMVSPPQYLDVNKGGFMFADVGSRVTSVHDVSVKNCIFQRFNVLQTGAEPSVSDASWADQNHFIDATSYMAATPGTNWSAGGTLSSLFVDAAAGNFTPVSGAPTEKRVQKPAVPADVHGRARTSPDCVGACTQQ
jgi:hypothetical protein